MQMRDRMAAGGSDMSGRCKKTGIHGQQGTTPPASAKPAPKKSEASTAAISVPTPATFKVERGPLKADVSLPGVFGSPEWPKSRQALHQLVDTMLDFSAFGIMFPEP